MSRGHIKHQIAESDVLAPWDEDDIHDIEIGMGVDFKTGLAHLVFDRYTRAVTLDQTQLRQLIQALEIQLGALMRGAPTGH